MQFWECFEASFLVQLRKHLRFESLLLTVTEQFQSFHFLSIDILHLFTRTRSQQSLLTAMVLLESKKQDGVPHPTRSQRTRECLAACIVPLISIVPLSDGLQPTSVTLVQLNSPTQCIRHRNSTKTYILLLNSRTMQNYA